VAALAADQHQVRLLPPSQIEDEKRTLLGLYIDAAEASRVLASRTDFVLIDVRPARLIAATGKLPQAVAHVPVLIERQRPADEAPDPAAPTMQINPHFVQELRAVLASHRLQETDANILLYCSMGLFTARAADVLAESGFSKVYAIVDAFR
jgi:rhodanese-related sulfurtransferase